MSFLSFTHHTNSLEVICWEIFVKSWGVNKYMGIIWVVFYGSEQKCTSKNELKFCIQCSCSVLSVRWSPVFKHNFNI